MGDTYTHAAIAAKIMAILRSALPQDRYEFFELGNWLTDLSQVRDPYAFTSAKSALGQKFRQQEAILASTFFFLIGAAGYIEDLMGSDTKEGDLAQWLRDLAFINGCEKFRRMGIGVDEFKNIFDSHLTQYYPHEHMDFPPWPHGELLGDRTPSDESCHTCSLTKVRYDAKRGKRKILKYLDEQITWLAYLFTKIEEQWAIPRPIDVANNRVRHELLVQFGHASHAVEDFFFHSNFVELAWSNFTEGVLGPNHPPSEHRIFFRRRRAPCEEGSFWSGKQLSTTTSTPAEYVFTGSFGSEDMFHSLVDAAEGLIVAAEQEGRLPDDFVKTVAPHLQETHADLQLTPQAEVSRLKKHRSLLESGLYIHKARQMVDAGVLHPESLSRFEHMNKLDLDLGKKYPSIAKEENGIKVPLGIVGMLQAFALLAKQTHDHSLNASKALDNDRTLADTRTFNGASAENIGSHSLMAKDSERKQPLRDQTVNIATCAAQYIAWVMVSRVKCSYLPNSRFDSDGNASAEFGACNTHNRVRFDWLHLLQHLLCHPDESEGPGKGWWTEAFQNQNANVYHNIRPIDKAEVDRRIEEEEKLRKKLEKKYQRLATEASMEYVREYLTPQHELE